MFGDVLLAPGGRVLSDAGTDTATEFIFWREWGFGELRHGHLTLWNPHVFSGVPFFGGFQAGLLYPPNTIYLFLPLAAAVNTEISLHVFVLGMGMWLWMRHRGLHPLACFAASAMMMFGGPYFLHIYAGHLATLDAMAWIPWILLAVDGWLARKTVGWLLLGAGVFALQILAGHPQTVFHTTVTLILYMLLRLIPLRVAPLRHNMPLLLGLIAAAGGALLLCAVQVLTGAQEAASSTRQGAVPFTFASMFSLPPENMLTLLVPGLFGDMTKFPYWGRCYLWEMSLFIGVSGFALAVYGAFCGEKERGRRTAIAMVVLLLLLALAAHTPLFRVLYDFVPGFNKFRSQSKFLAEMTVFGCLLAGMGIDRLLTDGYRSRSAAWVAACMALLLVGAGVWAAQSSASGAWGQLLASVQATQESYLPAVHAADPNFASAAGIFASRGLFASAGVCSLVAVGFWVVRRTVWAGRALAALAVLEVFWFGFGNRPTFLLSTIRPAPALTRFLARNPGDYRILNLVGPPEGAVIGGADDIWGYNPGVLKRYAQFMAWTQGQDPDTATMYVSFAHLPPLYALVRCRFGFVPDGQGGVRGVSGPIPLPHVLLVPQWTEAQGRSAVFAALSAPGFDPRHLVVLEHAPGLPPVPLSSSLPGTVQITGTGPDFLDIAADLSRPAMLLITDSYSEGWHAEAMAGSVQKQYTVMPGDYILRAIPLSAGHHALHLEYKPQAFTLGAWISAASLVMYLTLLAGWGCSRRLMKRTSSAPQKETL